MYGVLLMMALGNGAAAPGVDETMDRPEATPYASHGQQLYRHRRGRRGGCCNDSCCYGGGYGACGNTCGTCGGCGSYGAYGGSYGACDCGGGYAPYGRGYYGGFYYGNGYGAAAPNQAEDRGTALPMPQDTTSGGRGYYDNQQRNAPPPSDRNRPNPDGGSRTTPPQ